MLWLLWWGHGFMGIKCLWEEDGFHLARRGTSSETYTFLHRLLCLSVLWLSNLWGEPLLVPDFFLTTAMAFKNLQCKYHQVTFLCEALQGLSTWVRLLPCLENMQLSHKLHINQKHCCGRRRFSFYLSVYVKRSFLGPGLDWRFLEEATDLHTDISLRKSVTSMCLVSPPVLTC